LTTAAGAGRREQNRVQTWRELRSAGLELMTEHGFDGVSVEQIAAAANVSRATFSNYFDSKVAVVFDSDPDEPRIWGELLAAKGDDEPLWTSVAQVVLAHGNATAALLETQMRLKKGSVKLTLSSREAQTGFWRALSAWVEARSPAEPMTAPLIMNAALGVLTTAFDLWSPEQDAADFLHLAARGFDRLASVVVPSADRPLRSSAPSRR
jgi:AcrR family transcriptional regulator